MFDPFENRSSRDIRNQLSEAFLSALKAGKTAQLKKAADALRKKAPDADHISFIDDRLDRYTIVFEQLSPGSWNTPSDDFNTAQLLWEGELFFECHEWLEPLWQNASGMEKKALQGLIRAAGAFVLNEADRHAAAASSAEKALVLIKEGRTYLPHSFEPQQLISALESIASA
ncbi:MAG: DUF309 domain-containing protein [Desulfobacterales bacterium]|nr:DUF309 domain-containing protein [Desulfobacterales bacterium]